MSDLAINTMYIVSVVLFIFGLKMLGSPVTARRGNLISWIGMMIAIVVTLLSKDILEWQWIVTSATVGTIIGASAALLVRMTSMPEMVAAFNGFGGVASLLVGWAALFEPFNLFVMITVILSVVIGGVTFAGSAIAWGKLADVVISRAVVYPGQLFINSLVLISIVACAILFAMDANPYSPYFYAVVGLALVLGVLAVMSIGGADMPVVISLLNSYSGLAACAAGFAINNNILIVAGALVGAAGIILTNIMCKSMNRSLVNVLFSGFGTVKTATKVEGK